MILRYLLLPEIEDLLNEGRLVEIRDFLARQPAPEIAELLVALDDSRRVLLFRLLPRHLADEVFSLLNPSFQNRLLENMTREDVRQALAALPPDDRTALFEELPARVTKRLLEHLNDEDRQLTLTLLSYPEKSIGRLMTNRYVKVRHEWTVAEALEHLRKFGRDSETLMMIYIVDDQGRLMDDLPLHKLILADPATVVKDLLDGHYACLYSLQDRAEAIRVFRKYDYYALPVVDADQILLGIVTIDDILDIAEAENTEDLHKWATIRPLQISFKEASATLLIRKRLGWLLGLVGVGILSGTGISFFEETIAAVVALVFFLPLLTDSGGNAGSQTSTLVVRALAIGEITPADWLRLLRREVVLSTLLGLSMAAAVFLLGLWRSGPPVALIVALSMFAVILFGSLLGTFLPLILARFRLDPATASAPLITSLSDVFGVLIYFSIARALLPT